MFHDFKQTKLLENSLSNCYPGFHIKNKQKLQENSSKHLKF